MESRIMGFLKDLPKSDGPAAQFDEAAHPDPETPQGPVHVDPGTGDVLAVSGTPEPPKGATANLVIVDDPEHPDPLAADIPQAELDKMYAKVIPNYQQYQHLVAACREINEPKVASILARLIQAGVLPDKNLWQTDRRHQIVALAVERCKNENAIRGQWPFIRFLRGASIGNRTAECQLLIAWVLLGLVTEIYFEGLCKSDVPASQ